MASSPILREHAAGLPLVRPAAVPIDREAMRTEHDRSVEEGRAAGYADGFARAGAEAQIEAERARSRRDSALAVLAAALEGTTSALAVGRERLDRDSLELAFAIAEAVIGRELAVAVSPGSDAIRRALTESAVEEGTVLRMNPADAAEIADSTHLRGVTSIIPDPEIGRGGCVVECGPVLIDARIETALARVRQVLDQATGRT